MEPELRPDRCKVIFDTGAVGYDHVLTLHVDPGRPDAWRTPVITELMKRWLNDDNARVVILTGDKRRMFMLPGAQPASGA